MEYAVAFMIGISAVVIGLSCLFRAGDWIGWIKLLRAQGRPAALIMGYLHLLVGTFIVGFHWKWQGLPLLLTLLGVKAILEGVVYTLFPAAMLSTLAWVEPRIQGWLRIAGVATVIIGALIFHEWWQYMQECTTWQPCYNQAAISKQ